MEGYTVLAFHRKWVTCDADDVDVDITVRPRFKATLQICDTLELGQFF